MPETCVEKCNGNCCSHYSVLITDKDAVRIMKATGLKPKNFLCLFPGDTKNGEFYPKIRIANEEKFLGLKYADDLSCYFWMKG